MSLNKVFILCCLITVPNIVILESSLYNVVSMYVFVVEHLALNNKLL